MTLDSIHKAAKLDVRQILLPHYGVVSGETARRYLEQGQQTARRVSHLILEQLALGKTAEEILAHMTDVLYTDEVKPAYPYDAYRLNSGIMINLVRKELFSGMDR